VGLLDGKLALVTGGSRGLGRALCQTFAREGARVAFNWHRAEEEAAETLALLREGGRPAWSFRASVSDRAAVNEMVRALEAEAGGPVDILVNNAGHGQVVPLALMEEEDWDRMLDTHVKGAFLCSQAVLRGMIKAQRGRILNMGSLAGVKMMQAPVHYCTAKAALKGFTEALAKEIGRYGVTVNCLAPGVLEEGVSEHLPQARRDEYLRHCAMRRMGSFGEVAEVAAFLVSEKSSYLNGATIIVDGAV
jgi:NAD(P)-dependent dehydrogenase (short-subunit alcohol dehydrogenase family)